jgi:uncharacterized protein YycO
MKVAFYKAKYGTWFDKLIAKITNSKFSHCELVFSNGTAFSASDREGVRFAKIDFSSGHWELVTVDITSEQESLLTAWCMRQVNSKYDWLGVFLGWVGIHQQKKWFCSELCSEALTNFAGIELISQSKSISPEKLYKILTK